MVKIPNEKFGIDKKRNKPTEPSERMCERKKIVVKNVEYQKSIYTLAHDKYTQNSLRNSQDSKLLLFVGFCI